MDETAGYVFQLSHGVLSMVKIPDYTMPRWTKYVVLALFAATLCSGCARATAPDAQVLRSSNAPAHQSATAAPPTRGAVISAFVDLIVASDQAVPSCPDGFVTCRALLAHVLTAMTDGTCSSVSVVVELHRPDTEQPVGSLTLPGEVSVLPSAGCPDCAVVPVWICEVTITVQGKVPDALYTAGLRFVIDYEEHSLCRNRIQCISVP